MTELGKTLVVLGLSLTVVGSVLWLWGGRTWLGRLPGDIHVRGERSEFYFPIATCLLVSAALSLVSWILRNRR